MGLDFLTTPKPSLNVRRSAWTAEEESLATLVTHRDSYHPNPPSAQNTNTRLQRALEYQSSLIY